MLRLYWGAKYCHNRPFIGYSHAWMMILIQIRAPGRTASAVEIKVLFRKVIGNTGITIFEGIHDLIPDSGLAWLAVQRKGNLPVWNITGAGFSASGQGSRQISK